jgi:histidine triad (HIT) family protein
MTDNRYEMPDSDPVTNCSFCAIASGRDDSVEVVCEGSDWVAFFPLDPATPGHTLVIPRHHVPDLWSAEPELGATLMRAAMEVGSAIWSVLVPDGMNLITSSGAAAEQTVRHLHLHVVPRWAGDGIDEIWPPKRPMGERLKDDAAERIRNACAGETRSAAAQEPSD